ncbi:glycosyltransferase family 2 protein [Psychrobium sp. 1_MG-2023]|uniref:glycosyltransferase family 2 protein n=1 Tax=Psychrobium sp. 1_MG-2023 TaxID=3062624 RepID=UPI000C32ED6F|nr:glycosyltransferase family 2 protein [Psychrobium sp. 1_MG-2023]MDP2561333.1 glycosyltransferase family 2 protein [Psychrobium sp. 1_MG-2023]PKF54147.1 glycosyltransferase family 2 protein [Alteromonadales bacterium alter-6D02]
MISLLLIIMTLGCMLLIIYHHVGYPLLLKRLSSMFESQQHVSETISVTSSCFNQMLQQDSLSITIVIPAYNEEAFIADKIRNLAILDYPMEKLSIIIVCDGCTDQTAAEARAASQEPACTHLPITIEEYQVNRGKVAVLNQVMTEVTADIVAFSDVSALISMDALQQASQYFKDANVGLITGHYLLAHPGSTGEQRYWQYQSNLKQQEGALNSVIGAHGAFYLIRRELFLPMPTNTINDDFVIAMAVVEQGYRAIYASSINAVELECASKELDLGRRRRIAAGNLQQLIRFRGLLSPKYRAVAFMFGSGKALRVLMPLLLIGAWLGSGLLATSHWFFLMAAIGQSALYAAVILFELIKPQQPNPLWQTLYYLVSGYTANLLGCIHYAVNRGFRS